MLIGLVGKPSVGKSTFFKAATLAEVEIASYPFTTIKPNEGVGFVKAKDPALQFEKHSNPRDGFVVGEARFIPVQLMDVAGLVPGAHEGAGMGNQFLDDLRQADVLIHVIDISGSTNEKGEAVDAGSYDPANDVKFLEEELDYWYLNLINKGWDKFARQIQQEKTGVAKALGKQLSGLKVTVEMVEDSIKKLELSENPTEWTKESLFDLAQELRKLTKPMVVACNKVDTPTGRANYDMLIAQFPDTLLIPCSAGSELALREAAKKDLIDYVPGEQNYSLTEKGEAEISDAQKKGLEYIKDNVLGLEKGSGVQAALNAAVFDKLKYIPIFPGGAKLADKDGNVLPDCFLMPPGSTALDFAYRLHTDFGKNFIRAIDIKTKLTVGKEHPLQFGDIVEIVSGK